MLEHQGVLGVQIYRIKLLNEQVMLALC